MFGWIANLFGLLLGIWNKIPQETREEIIEEVVNFFSDIFRKYYKSEKSEGESKQNA